MYTIRYKRLVVAIWCNTHWFVLITMTQHCVCLCSMEQLTKEVDVGIPDRLLLWLRGVVVFCTVGMRCVGSEPSMELRLKLGWIAGIGWLKHLGVDW